MVVSLVDSSGLIICCVSNGCWTFLYSGQGVVEVFRRTPRDAVPALCGSTCALADARLVNVLLCILLIGKVIFAYRRHGWFSLKLRDMRLEMKSRWYWVEKLNIGEWSFAPILNAALFCLCCSSPLQIFRLFSVVKRNMVAILEVHLMI